MPKKALTVSIVIPAYNEEHHLKACLDSIKNQIVKPDEVIVVDNNSSDKTVQRALSYSFVSLVNENKQGVVYARDKGFNAAKSDIIGRIDADSVLPKNWVKHIKAFYDDPNHKQYALTGGGYPTNLRLPKFWGWLQGQLAFRINRLLLGHYILYGSNMAIPRAVWQKVKLDVCHDNRVHEDLDLAIHVHKAGYKIFYQESLRAGVTVRRILSNRDQLWDNCMLWPQTLKRHRIWTWVFGWVGAFLLFLFSPLLFLIEKIGTFIGRR